MGNMTYEEIKFQSTLPVRGATSTLPLGVVGR